MSNLHNERYDEIKSLLKKSKMIFEQKSDMSQINVAKDIETKISQDADEFNMDDEEGPSSCLIWSISIH